MVGHFFRIHLRPITRFYGLQLLSKSKNSIFKILLSTLLPCRWWHDTSALQVVAAHVCPSGGCTARLPFRWLHDTSALQVVARHVCPAGGCTAHLPYRWLHGTFAPQVVARHVCPTGGCTARLPRRWLHGTSALQVVPRHVCPTGGGAEVVQYSTKLNYHIYAVTSLNMKK